MLRHLAVLAAVLAPAATALAQAGSSAPPAEKVIVTAPKFVPDSVIKDFVESRAAPSAALGKVARWSDSVCPTTDGLPQRWTDFINRRVRQIAAEVGAPVREAGACKTNIEIVFTTTPQKLMDNVRAQHPQLLGYHYRPQEAQLATFSRPIQAWYMTETEDSRGMRSTDDANPKVGFGLQIGSSLTNLSGATTSDPFFFPGARGHNVTQGRLGDGLRSDLYHVLVVADPGQLRDFEMGSLADYIAMLALSQAAPNDGCRQVPSITNLLSAACDAAVKPVAISDFDLAYLRGLYKMDAGSNLAVQRGAIAYQMKQSLEGR